MMRFHVALLALVLVGTRSDDSCRQDEDDVYDVNLLQTVIRKDVSSALAPDQKNASSAVVAALHENMSSVDFAAVHSNTSSEGRAAVETNASSEVAAADNSTEEVAAEMLQDVERAKVSLDEAKAALITISNEAYMKLAAPSGTTIWCFNIILVLALVIFVTPFAFSSPGTATDTCPDVGVAAICECSGSAPVEYSVGEVLQRLLRVQFIFCFTWISSPFPIYLLQCKVWCYVFTFLAPPMRWLPWWISMWVGVPIGCIFALPIFYGLVMFLYALVRCIRANDDISRDANMEGLETDNRFLVKLIHIMYIQYAHEIVEYYAGAHRMPKDQCQLTFSKDYWRGVLTRAGVPIPVEVARWKQLPKEKGELTWHKEPDPTKDLVSKEETGRLGHGDFLIAKGEWSTKSDVLEVYRKQINLNVRKCEEAILLERVYPRKDLGVHVIRIQTSDGPSGKVGVMDTTMQFGSSTWTSHTGQRQYRINPEKECFDRQDHWFRNRRTWEFDEADRATKLTGVKEACLMAIKAHQESQKDHPRRYMIGWDFMFTEDGGIVAFEGNSVALRVGRVITPSWATTFSFCRHFAWPMGWTIKEAFEDRKK